MIDADYADDLVLLENRLAQAKSLLQAEGVLVLYVFANKTGFMYFK